jgi:hypothetical protein
MSNFWILDFELDLKFGFWHLDFILHISLLKTSLVDCSFAHFLMYFKSTFEIFKIDSMSSN